MLFRGAGPGDPEEAIAATHLALLSFRVPLPEEEQTSRRKTQQVTLKVRVVEYRVGENERVRLVTNLLNTKTFPARELAEFYHVRWEVEMAFDEIKNHLATVTHGTLHTTFRSKSPEGILQEAYGLLVAYNLIRELMQKAGEEHGLNPLEISFTESLAVLRRAVVRFEMSALDAIPELATQLLRDVAACVIDRPRRQRIYPRVVKIKMTKFKLKRSHHRQTRLRSKPEVRLLRRYRKKRKAA